MQIHWVPENTWIQCLINFEPVCALQSERVLQRKLSVLGQTNEKLREEIVAVHRELSEAKSESMEKLRLLRAAGIARAVLPHNRCAIVVV